MADKESIFHRALEIDDRDERARFLENACEGDVALRRDVEELLVAASSDTNLLEAPISSSSLGQASGIESDTQIDGYNILQELGEGGFGVVYMAKQTVPVSRKVAIKVIKPGMNSKEVVARFEAERQALALMEHPNIARVFDGGQTQTGRPYFVMELVHGLPITEYADERKLMTRQRLELFAQVCAAVQHAHRRGIIHRDIKPSNVMVTQRDGLPVVKVIDFGVSKALNQKLTDKTLFTAYGQMIGTPQYMSPEQAEFNELDIDTRTDVYSLGVLLYELLSGSTPLTRQQLENAGLAEVQRLIKEEEAPKLTDRISSLGERLTTVAACRSIEPGRLQSEVRGELDWIVQKALDKERNRRYDNPASLAADVERYIRGDVIEASPPNAIYRLKKFVRRNRRVVAAVSLTTIALLVGLIGVSYGLYRSMSATAIAQAGQKTAEDERDRVKRIVKIVSDMILTSGRDGITVDEMIADFEPRLPELLKDDPLVEADFRIAMGGQENLTRAIKLLEKHGDDKSALGTAYARRGGPGDDEVAMELWLKAENWGRLAWGCFGYAMDDKGRELSTEEQMDWIERGYDYLENGDHPVYRAFLDFAKGEKLRSMDPGEAKTVRNLMMNASETFRKAPVGSLDVAHDMLFYTLLEGAQAQMLLGHPTEALVTLDELNEYAATTYVSSTGWRYLHTHVHRIAALLQLRKYDEAIQHVSGQIDTLDASSFDCHTLRSIRAGIHMVAGDERAAEQDWQAIFSTTPFQAWAGYYMMYLGLGEDEEKRAKSRAMTLQSLPPLRDVDVKAGWPSSQALFMLALSSLKEPSSEDLKLARSLCPETLRLARRGSAHDARSTRWRYSVARFERMHGDAGEAIEILEELLRESNANDVPYGLGNGGPFPFLRYAERDLWNWSLESSDQAMHKQAEDLLRQNLERRKTATPRDPHQLNFAKFRFARLLRSRNEDGDIEEARQLLNAIQESISTEEVPVCFRWLGQAVEKENAELNKVQVNEVRTTEEPTP